MATSTPSKKPILPTAIPTVVTALPNSTATSEIQKCLRLLGEGKSKVITNQTDIVFLLGMTGSGKTTLVKFLATNNDHLISEEITENIGEYVIKDLDDKISSSTLLSKTIFPELFIDPETKIAFEDDPGFNDSRGLAEDITGAYFVNKVITESKKIRFILTINYSSVRHGMDRGDFLDLLKHVLHVVKNIHPYLDSIALVVTKVDNQMMKKDRELVLVPDENVLESVAKFLLEFKSNIPSVAQGSTAEDMGKLVDVFLRKKGSTYEKIALFRRPDEAGPISKIQTLKEAKTGIKKMIRENLKPATVNKEDFGIAISEESKNKLHDVMAAINDNIASAIREACNSKILIYEGKTAESTDIYEVYEMLRSDFETLRNWLANKSEDTSLKNFLDDLLGMSKNMKTRFSDEEISHILNQGEYILFIETINGKKFKDSVSSWKNALQSYLTYLKESTNWYKLLTIWHTVLTSYSVQKKQNEFAHLLEHPVTNLHDDQFSKLLTFCKSLNAELEGLIQSVKMDSTKMGQFNRLLVETLKSNSNSTYDEKSKTLMIRGKYVKLSEHLAQTNVPEAHFINVFATDKLFIDANFNRLSENLQTLYLAAPTWEVIGAVQINLDGAKGCCEALYRAADGNQSWKSGRRGKPGAPGKSAANFIGLANAIINAEYLKISANGGEGGAGQDGGNGDDGDEGDSPITTYGGDCFGNDYDRFYYQKLGGVVRGVYCIYGKAGDDGGNGGDGGAGGFGGRSGKIIFPLNLPLNTKIEANNGAAGKAGLGGEGGRGGKAGRSWNHQTMLGSWRAASCSRSQRLADEYGDCANSDYLRNGHRGYKGSTGGNFFGAEEAGYTDLIDSEATAKKYREFLQQESGNDTISRRSKIEFLNKLNNMPRSKTLSQFTRYKRMAKLLGKQLKSGPLDSDMPKCINNDCFPGPQWPITEKIGHSQATTLASTSVPLTDLLMLTDLLIRKLNQTKPNYFQSCIDDDVEVRGCALHILTIFEKTLANIHGNKNGEPMDIDIDPIAIMGKLEKELRNGSPQNIVKILLDSFNEMPEYKEELHHQLIIELQLDSA